MDTEKCIMQKCSVGFVKKVIDHAENNFAAVIEDGLELIPQHDIRIYDETHITHAIANICKLCKQCNENHSEKCVLSLCRRSLENAVLKENVNYPGNVLMYIVEVSKQNSYIGKIISDDYQKLD